jgi:hypothetical protein
MFAFSCESERLPASLPLDSRAPIPCCSDRLLHHFVRDGSVPSEHRSDHRR